MGESLQDCMDALEATEDAKILHILERISIHLSVENSIVPSVASLPRFKASGKLPSLHVNFSDQKYKTLMRLLDVAIPRFDDNSQQAPAPIADGHPGLRAVPRLFSQNQQDYIIEDDADRESIHEDASGGKAVTVKKPEGVEKDSAVGIYLFCYSIQFISLCTASCYQQNLMFQHMFDLTFHIDTLRVAIFKSTNGKEKPLGEIALQTFAFAFTLKQFDMNVEIGLGCVACIC